MKTDFNPKQKAINAIRKLWKNSPMRKLALDMACVDLKVPVKKRKYKCEICKQEFYAQHIEVDHLSSSSHDSLDVFLRNQMCGILKIKKGDSDLERLICKMENDDTMLLKDVVFQNLQVLCIDCHKMKTKEDNKKVKTSKKGRGNGLQK